MRVINNLPFGEKSTVIDSLDSDSTTYALSANQGKVLNEKHTELEESLEWGSFTDPTPTQKV